MKKVFVLALLLLIIISSSIAQDDTATATGNSSFLSKSGQEVLPREGDFTLTVGATSILRYAGNLFGKTNNNNYSDFLNYPNLNLPTFVVGGKYMLSNNTALRMAARIYYTNSTSKVRVDDDLSINPDDFLYDKSTLSNFGITLGAGMEKRRGPARLQGIYGAEIYLSYSNGMVREYEYANVFSTVNQFPSSSVFPNSTSLPAPALGYRIKRQALSDGFGAGLNIFAGVEYFIAPKISLGADFYWGISYAYISAETLTYESFDPVNETVIEYSVKGESTRSISADLDNLGGEINLNFFF
ncbi:MAG: hypothetical protein JW973_13105 [Bacteroidales bacterium]|nr:hypothetical protein [Bacteroidales bacterium]